MSAARFAFVVLALGMALVLSGMFAPAFAGMRNVHPVQDSSYQGSPPDQENPASYDRGRDMDPYAGGASNMPLDSPDRGPAFSSPDVRLAPNGDRVSPYAPGYRPDNTSYGGSHHGGSHRR